MFHKLKNLFPKKFLSSVGNTPIRYIYHIPEYLAFILFRIFPIKTNKVVFSSRGGKDFCDNPKYIAIELNSRDTPFTDLVWIVANESLLERNSLPPNIRPVYSPSFKAIYELSTAKFWIDSERKPHYTLKRKGQYYIQTWHGSVALKKIEKDASAVLHKYCIHDGKSDSNKTDLITSGSTMGDKLYRDAFMYSGELLHCGDPRNDLLVSCAKQDFNRNNILEKIFGSNNPHNHKKIYLYAPTFRRSKTLDVYNLDLQRCGVALQDKFGSEWICLFRLHPDISYQSMDIPKGAFEIIDVTLYPDMQELLAVSDVLITDYSSCMFDFILTQRPCFLYQPDISEYCDDRGFYIELDDLPFPRGETNDEFISEIMMFNDAEYLNNLAEFDNYIHVYDRGGASSAVVTWMINKTRGERR